MRWFYSLFQGSRGAGGSELESEFLDIRPAASNGIDLQGYRIGMIGFRLDYLRLESPGSDPNGDGVWTEFDWGATVLIYPDLELVPCAGPGPGGRWKNHGQYVSTVVEVIREALIEGLVSEEEAEMILEAAAQSDCGRR